MLPRPEPGTAGFTLPMIDILAEARRGAHALFAILHRPAQISENFEMYGVNHQLSMAC